LSELEEKNSEIEVRKKNPEVSSLISIQGVKHYFTFSFTFDLHTNIRLCKPQYKKNE